MAKTPFPPREPDILYRFSRRRGLRRQVRLTLLTWMIGTNTVLVMGLLWLVSNLNAQIAALAAKIP